jgi:hypothetical protein
MGLTSDNPETAVTKVVIRRWKDSGDLIALFPEEPADVQGNTVSSYMHVGAHGSANYEHVISQTKKLYWWDEATVAFIDELKSIGYNVAVYQKRTPEMRYNLYNAAKRLREYDAAKVAEEAPLYADA